MLSDRFCDSAVRSPYSAVVWPLTFQFSSPLGTADWGIVGGTSGALKSGERVGRGVGISKAALEPRGRDEARAQQSPAIRAGDGLVLAPDRPLFSG